MVRPATLKDSSIAVSLYRKFREYFNYPNLEERYEIFISDIILDDKADFLLYECESGAKGFILVNQIISSFSMGKCIWVLDLWIDEDKRGAYALAEVLNGLQNYAKEVNSNNISFVAWTKLGSLRRLYRMMGFKEEPLTFFRQLL